MMPVDTYKYNFQYDGNALSADASDRDSAGFHLDYYTKPGSRAANVYTNTTGEPVNIEAVGYTTFTNGDQAYDVSVYTGLTDPTDPTSGKLQGTTRVTTSTRGCKTAVLDDPVYVAPGKTYSIVFDFTDFSAFGVETEASSPYFLFEADTDPGQSFFSRSKSSKWVDMNDYEACFRIKGFANPTELIPEEKGPDQRTVKPSQTDGKASPESDTTKTQKAQKLPAVKISSLAAATGSAKLQWNKLSSADAKNVTGIEIQYSTSKSFKKGVKTVTAKATAKSKKIKKLKSNKKYYVRMRTYKKANGKKTTSKWSKVKSVKVK
jgi:hypothetical protein